MWYYLTDKMYDEFLLSFNLFKTNDIKKVKRTLYYLSNNLDANYISFDIPKKNGKLRTIYEPSGLLKNVQRNILKNILEDKKISKYAKAYQRHISLVDFKLNYDKIKVIRNNNRQIVTGIVVNKKLSIKREYKKKIRQEIYYINKYGIDSHLKKLNIDNKNKYLHSLKGKVNFVLQVEDNNKEFKKYQIYIDNLLFKIPISN